MKNVSRLLLVLAWCLLLAACNSSSSDSSTPAPSGSSGDTDDSGSSAAVIALPQTGQTICYDAVGNVIACAGTGQDGDLLKGVAHPTPRFTDNGDGTVTDNLTGLMWMATANCIAAVHPGFDADGTVGDGRVVWQHGLDFAAAVNVATYDCNVTTAYTDWRLANVRELESLVDLGQASPALSAGHPFTGVVSSWYWSSSSFEASPDFAWFVYFYYGNVVWLDKGAGTCYVWLVRAGQ